MKKSTYLAALLPLLLVSCSQDEEMTQEPAPSQPLLASVTSFTPGGDTRITTTDLHDYRWETGDQIGVYYQSDAGKASAEFTLTSGGDSSVGTFMNQAFSLKPNTTYYACYPYDYTATPGALPVSFPLTQEQTANASCTHIGENAVFWSAFTTDSQGCGSIAFSQVGAVLCLNLTLPDDAVYTSVQVTSSGAAFATKGTVDMHDGLLTPSASAYTLTLTLGSGLQLTKGQVLTAYMLVSPVDLTGGTLNITLKDSAAQTYTVQVDGEELLSGRIYTCSKSLLPPAEEGGNGTGTLIPGEEHTDTGDSGSDGGNGTGTLTPGTEHAG